MNGGDQVEMRDMMNSKSSSAISTVTAGQIYDSARRKLHSYLDKRYGNDQNIHLR